MSSPSDLGNLLRVEHSYKIRKKIKFLSKPETFNGYTLCSSSSESVEQEVFACKCEKNISFLLFFLLEEVLRIKTHILHKVRSYFQSFEILHFAF